MGPFTGDDTRTFAIAAVDGSGNVSPQTATLARCPGPAGMTTRRRLFAPGRARSRPGQRHLGRLHAAGWHDRLAVRDHRRRTRSTVNLSSSGGLPAPARPRDGYGHRATGDRRQAAQVPTASTTGRSRRAEYRRSPTSPAASGLAFTVAARGASRSRSAATSAPASTSRAPPRSPRRSSIRRASPSTPGVSGSAPERRRPPVVPAKVKKSGRYTVAWRASSSGQTVRRQITVQISVGSSRSRPRPNA